METRNVSLTLEKAKEFYKKGGDLKEVALAAYTEDELNPNKNTWINILKTYKDVYCTGYKGEIISFETKNIKGGETDVWKNSIPSKEAAEKIIAICQISILADYYNKKSKFKGSKWAPALQLNKDIVAVKDLCWNFPFCFHSQKDLEDAIENNKEIFNAALR